MRMTFSVDRYSSGNLSGTLSWLMVLALLLGTVAANSPVLGASSTTDKIKKKSRKLTVDDLNINNTDKLESYFKVREYSHPCKFNIFQDLISRIEWNTDTDGDGKVDAEDDDDDNDGFTDLLEAEYGTNPRDRFSRPFADQIKSRPIDTYPDGDSPSNHITSENREDEQIIPEKPDQKDNQSLVSGIYFKGLFGLRSNKIAVLKVLKPHKQTILLRREGERFQGLTPGISFLIEKVDLKRDFIHIRRFPDNETINLRLTMHRSGEN